MSSENNSHDHEILTDNTKILRCKQCKDCILWGHGDAFSNAYDKSCCDMFVRPNYKPVRIMNDADVCPYRVTKEEQHG